MITGLEAVAAFGPFFCQAAASPWTMIEVPGLFLAAFFTSVDSDASLA